MGQQLIPPRDHGAEEIALHEALEERYLAYALSTIVNRALPDARDGLNPVHRRLLYAMQQLRLDPGAAFKKCARVVGDVIGKFHPHGDQAVYDALVRLTQEFAQRYPLIDGQGNFGNVDGDNPAAMRYTEARLTDIAQLLLAGIDEDAIDFKPTYDGSENEPVVLPGAFPNLLANGSQGIAVGMATSIPPHNAAELCDAALHLIATPNARSRTLLKYVPGPDFPTGGVIVDPPELIAEAYSSGRGSFRVRVRWHKEDTGRGTYLIIVTEIPWLVQKGRLVERLAELINEKKLPLVADARDESAEDIKLVIEPRSRTVDAALLMESLFKLTELESRIPLNMNVLIRGRIPKVVGLAEALTEWLAHRREVLVRRSRFRLNQIDHRLEVLGGYLVAYLNLDRVIRIIRSEDEPKPVLMKTFRLSDVQADAVLNMRLRNLRRLEEMQIRHEDKELRSERKSLKDLLASEKAQWSRVAEEIRQLRARFGPKTALGKRRTGFAEAPEHDESAIEQALVEREPIRLFIDLEQEADLVRVFRYQGARKLLVASAQGRGFVVPEDECVAITRKGKQVLNVTLPDAARAVAAVEGDLVAAIGENRKMIVFPLDQVPEMTRGRGVRLQRYKDGGLSDIKTFKTQEGLAWTDAAGRAFSSTIGELADWRGNRADAGRLAPKGFPRSNRFGG